LRQRRWSKKKRIAYKRTKQILGIPTSEKDARGFEAENAVEQALIVLREEGRIRNYFRTIKYSEDDLAGKDFIIRLLDEEILPLQVKTYYDQTEINSYLEKGIWPVIINLFNSEGQRKPFSKVKREAKKAILEVIANFEKEKERKEEAEEAIEKREGAVLMPSGSRSFLAKIIEWLKKGKNFF